ncbi:MAG: TRAM domain-containing protein [Luteitalea sp.]|nr:TRAM domain-containing protein [Luteitalea sp.]
MIAPGQLVDLNVEKPAAGGRMIARFSGQIVLVSGAIPGEQITARIERVRQGVAFAETVRVEAAAPDRREPFTDPLCGGCLYAHITYPRQVEIKAQVIADAFARIGRMPLAAPVDVAPSSDDGYRMRARLHVRDGRIGFFREGSHQICDARATRQLLPETCDALDAIAARSGSIHAWGVRELVVSENTDASERVVHLETAGHVDLDALRPLGQTPGVTGLTATPATVLAGDPHLRDTIAVGEHRVALRRHVLSFFQGNRYLLADLVAHVMEQIARDDDVIDLYAGAGLFSVAAAVVRRARVTAVEGDPIAAADLKQNASALGNAVEVVHQPVEAFVVAHRDAPAVLIVDPPRTGMSREALEGAIRLQPSTIVYVSCDVATIARDARRLLDAGYALQHLRGFDLFPNTPHVEIVGRFQKISGLQDFRI